MGVYRAVVAATLLAAVNSKAVHRRQAAGSIPCEDLMAAGERFSFNGGHTSVCAAAKIPDSTGTKQCFVSTSSFTSASERCEAMGARLCTADELNSNVAQGAGCQTGAPSSYCWVSDTDAECGGDNAYLTRCKEVNRPLKTCMPHDFAGTIVCCADGDLARVVQVEAEHCASAICGATCSEMDGCGWSTKLNKCIPGARTSKGEMDAGVCSTAELRTGCARHICGADCADDESGGCTWSKSRGMCIEGTRPTPENQRSMGICSPPEMPATEDEAKHLCKKIPCAISCTGICGWSSDRKKCLFGKKTSPTELESGECNVDYTGAVPQAASDLRTDADPCLQYLCGADCADAPEGCGWVSESQKCVSGARTSNAERSQGLCIIDTPDNHFCKQFACGQECSEYPGCGWSKRRMMCLAGHDTKPNEMAMCREETTTETPATDGAGAGEGDGNGDLEPDQTAPPTTKAPTTQAPVTASPTTQAPTTAAPVPVVTVEGCDNFPAGWVDADGDGCDRYAAEEWCADGGAGPAWNMAESFAQYANDGTDASYACCVCGGGKATRSAKTCSELDFDLTNSDNMTDVCGSSYDAEGECHTLDSMDATWEEANAACRGMGARLCTANELWSNVPQGTGCRLDKLLIWGSTSCPDGSHFAGFGRNPTPKDIGLSPGCRESSAGAAVRCCGDV